MALGAGEVDEPTFAEDGDAVAVLQGVLVDEVAHGALRGVLLQPGDVDLDVEVPAVGDDGAVLHLLEVGRGEDRGVAGDGAEEVADPGRIHAGHDPEAVHGGLQRLERIDLGDDDVGAHALGAHGETAAAPAVAHHHEDAAGEETIRRADDAVDGRLAGAVAVVEHVLGQGVVDGDDREGEVARGLHGAQALDARGRLLGAADDVLEELAPVADDAGDEIAAVVHGDVGLVIERGLDVLEVGGAILALDGVDGDALVDQRRGDVVLRAQGIAGAEDQIGAARLQRLHEQRGLGGHVQAGGDAQALERLHLGEAGADVAQHRHRALGPFDAAVALLGQVQILDVVRGLHLILGDGHR